MSHTRRQSFNDGMVVGALADADRKLRMRRTAAGVPYAKTVTYRTAANITDGDILPPFFVHEDTRLTGAVHLCDSGFIDIRPWVTFAQDPTTPTAVFHSTADSITAEPGTLDVVVPQFEAIYLRLELVSDGGGGFWDVSEISFAFLMEPA
jgi:hypothetical protein